MKIRSGFVSNSSSSSFILIGIKLKPEMLLNNVEYKSQYDEEYKEYEKQLVKQWEDKVNHPDYEKHKGIYEMCKTNNVSIPSETSKFFGYGFKGVFEPIKVNEKSLIMEMVNERKFNFPKEVRILSDDSVTYMGKILTDNEEIGNGSLSLEDFNNYIAKLVEVGFKPEDIKIHYGTRAC